MTNDNGLMMRQTTAIEAYGNREDVREIADRLMALHPAASEVGATAMRAVAQLALMRGANPLPTAGEIYVWTDRGQVVMDIGIAYYRRIASKKDTVVWSIEPRLMTNEERDHYNIPQGDIGAICKGALLSSIRELTAAGATFQEARDSVARTATAIVEHDDQHYGYDTKYKKKGDPRQSPHGRTWEWVAEKRAEKAFYKTMSLVDDSLTQRIDSANQIVKQVDDAYVLHLERENYTADDANRDFGLIDADGDRHVIEVTGTHYIDPETAKRGVALAKEIMADDEPATAQADIKTEVTYDDGELPVVTIDQNSPLYRNFHATGQRRYGDEWDDKRAELVAAVSKKRTRSSLECTPAEISKLVSGMTE